MIIAMVVAAAGSGVGHPLWHLVLPVVVSAGVFGGLKVSERWHAHTARMARTATAVMARQATPVSSVAGGQPPAKRWMRPAAPVAGLALASAGASAIHAAVCPAHFREATAFGVFFLLAAALQAAWAVLILRQPGRALLTLGAIGNLVVVGLWTMSRTVGVPIGPEVWRPEAITVADSLATTLELAIIIGIPWFVFRQQRAASKLVVAF